MKRSEVVLLFDDKKVQGTHMIRGWRKNVCISGTKVLNWPKMLTGVGWGWGM